MTYTIEKGIAIPNKRTRRSKYPFDEMELGDSFFVPAKKTQKIVVLRSNLLTLAKRADGSEKKFTTAIQIDGVRIWRIR